MEAEFIACSAAVQEAGWLRRFFMNFGIQNDNNAVTVYCDNQATITFLKDPKFHNRTKHIDTRYNYIKDIISR